MFCYVYRSYHFDVRFKRIFQMVGYSSQVIWCYIPCRQPPTHSVFWSDHIRKTTPCILVGFSVNAPTYFLFFVYHILPLIVVENLTRRYWSIPLRSMTELFVLQRESRWSRHLYWPSPPSLKVVSFQSCSVPYSNDAEPFGCCHVVNYSLCFYMMAVPIIPALSRRFLPPNQWRIIG